MSQSVKEEAQKVVHRVTSDITCGEVTKHNFRLLKVIDKHVGLEQHEDSHYENIKKFEDFCRFGSYADHPCRRAICCRALIRRARACLFRLLLGRLGRLHLWTATSRRRKHGRAAQCAGLGAHCRLCGLARLPTSGSRSRLARTAGRSHQAQVQVVQGHYSVCSRGGCSGGCSSVRRARLYSQPFRDRQSRAPVARIGVLRGVVMAE